MERIKFEVVINGPVARVYDVMLGITDRTTYEQWTAMFNPTSTYEGNWEEGSKMLFVGTDENGNRGGMVSEVAEHIPHRFVSIRHYGLVKGNEEITSGAEVEAWADGRENYTFEENDGITTVTVELDTAPDFIAYMNDTYPMALGKLKELCEA